MKLRWKIFIGLVVVLLAAYVYLIKINTRPSDCHFAIDLPRLRQLAASSPGPKPREIRYERLLTFQMPEAVVETGRPWARTALPVFAYQLVYDDHTIMVDTAMTRAQADGHGDDYDDAAWARVQKALASAQAIYVTHEHADHMGGLVAGLSTPSVLAAARPTKEQLDHPENLGKIVIPAELRGQLHGLEYGDLVAAAPGVVLIKAPGHTAGSQLVYVQLANGKELLFVGDTAWHTSNISDVTGPPHLTGLMLKNDRLANVCQLAALHDLQAQNSGVAIVPGHAGDVIDALTASGLLIKGFK